MSVILFCLFCILQCIHGSIIDHEYKEGEVVDIWTHSISFEGSSAEKQNYYYTGLCVPPKNKTVMSVSESPADILFKESYQKSLISVYFRVTPPTSIEIECKEDINAPSEIRKLRKAIKRNATFQWYIGGISASSLVGGIMTGETGTLVPGVYTHRQFNIGYNGNRIVEASVRSGRPVELKMLYERPLIMTYEVVWYPSTKVTGERFNISDRNKEYFESGKRWMGLSNVYLVAAILLVATITIHKNALRGTGEEHIWTCMSKDILHPPARPALISALLGLGAQCVATLVLFFAAGFVGRSSGTTSVYELLCKIVMYYGIAGLCGGIVSGKAFASYKGRSWLYPYLYLIGIPYGIVMGLLILMDFMGSYMPSSSIYGPMSYFSIHSKIYLSLYWLITVIPLTFAGTLLGRSLYAREHQSEKDKNHNISEGNSTNTPTQTNNRWYHKKIIPLFLCAIAGGSAALTELIFVYEGVWGVSGYYCYITYGFTLLSIIGALLVMGFGSALTTYYLLGMGNPSWKWTSIECGALSGVVVLIFSWSYYVNIGMNGVFQTMAYIAFSAVVSIMVALSEGFVAYVSSKYFVGSIYGLSKSE